MDVRRPALGNEPVLPASSSHQVGSGVPGRGVSADAARVLATINDNPHEGAAALVVFANENAVTTRLKHEALVLRFSQRDASSDGELLSLRDRMVELVSRIEADHVQRSGTPDALARENAWRKLREHFLDQPLLDEPVAVARGLGKGYPGTPFRLHGVDLSIQPGEITAVVGQNAHGKTTLLRMLAGELRADEGSVTYPLLTDRGVQDWVHIKSQIAYLPQDLPNWHGVLVDNLHYEAALHGLVGHENEREVDFFVERLGLREHLHKRWSELSGGYKLRFALARVLIWRPKLLILDEPLANLDVLAQGRLLQDLSDLARSRRHPLGVIMSSQHLHELEAVATNMLFLRQGEVVFNGAVKDIGSLRAYNVYELGTSADANALKRLFDGDHGPPSHNGVSYVVRTGRDVDAASVLKRLLEAGIAVHYFRDISRSIKSLFE